MPYTLVTASPRISMQLTETNPGNTSYVVHLLVTVSTCNKQPVDKSPFIDRRNSILVTEFNQACVSDI